MRITYIEHSGFAVEWDTCIWIFDYYRGELPPFDPKKRLYVFSSHAHQDHFEPKIFSMSADHPAVTYILSADIRKKVKRMELSAEQLGRIVWIAPDQELKFSDEAGEILCVRALHSTDCGVAFLCAYRDRRIYHAGDLNCWVWEGDSRQDRNNMTARYEREIGKLSGIKIDCAFIPVDHRLESTYDLGPRYFMDHVEADHVFPMHLWGRYRFAGKFRDSFGDPAQRERIVTVTHGGQQWDYGIVERIEEPDFGCEGRSEGEAVYDKVYIRLDDGNLCVREAEDRELYDRGIDEKDSVLLDTEGRRWL